MTDLHRNYAEKATATRRSFNEAQKILRDDYSLSDAGRQVVMANLYTATRKELTELAESHRRAVAERRRELERKVFTPPGGTGVEAVARQASYRDALSRVEQIERGDQSAALKLLDRADRTGDGLLARAIAAVGSERGWNQALAAYAENRSDASESLSDLLELQRRESDREWKLLAVTLGGVSKPEEVRRMTDDQIAEVAAADVGRANWAIHQVTSSVALVP